MEGLGISSRNSEELSDSSAPAQKNAAMRLDEMLENESHDPSVGEEAADSIYEGTMASDHGDDANDNLEGSAVRRLQELVGADPDSATPDDSYFEGNTSQSSYVVDYTDEENIDSAGTQPVDGDSESP